MANHSLSTLLRLTNLNPWPGGLDVSSRGDYAAVSWNKSGLWEIWLVPLNGKGKPKRVTHPPQSKHSPRFSPDGTKLGWPQDFDGDEKHDLYVYDLATGETRNAMPGTDDALNDSFAWSPDSRHAALVSNRGGRFALHVLDTHTGQLHRLTDHAYSDLIAQWSPDGTRIAFNAFISGQTTYIFIVPAIGGEARVIADANGPLDAHSPHWSPDSQRLAFVGHPGNTAAIGVYDLNSSAVEWVSQDRKWDHDSPAWSPDGCQLAYTVNRDGSLSLVVADLARRRRRRFEVEPGCHVEPVFAPDGDIVTVFHSARRPADLWKLNPKTGQWTQLTHSLPARVKPSHFVSPTVMRWRSSDGLPISGLFYAPKGKLKKRPLLLFVHGGPSWQSFNGWYALVQIYVAEGWNVLCPNYRGSTGYGKTFQEANRYVMGHADIADVVVGAQYLVRQGLADPWRIGLTGGSYGGYLTMVGLTRYPEFFAVGSAVVPFINWFTEFESEREDLRYWDLQNIGDPQVNPERFHAASPLFFLDRVAAPVQMLAGAHDPRCPAAETRQAADELARMGKTHDVLIFPNEGHGFLKMSNRVKAYTRQLKFLRKYL